MIVTGISVEKAEEIENASIVAGHVNESGHLVLESAGGVETDAGAVVVPYSSWPIGSIYINASVATNPSVLLGGGTWSLFGAGKVLVGVDSGDPTFDTLGETGGAKTHTLTEAEMPAHDHTGLVTDAGQHNHGVGMYTGTGGANIKRDGSAYDSAQVTSDAGLHNHGIPSDGGGGAHNNLQPFITVYMWLRTA